MSLCLVAEVLKRVARNHPTWRPASSKLLTAQKLDLTDLNSRNPALLISWRTLALVRVHSVSGVSSDLAGSPAARRHSHSALGCVLKRCLGGVQAQEVAGSDFQDSGLVVTSRQAHRPQTLKPSGVIRDPDSSMTKPVISDNQLHPFRPKSLCP